MEPDSTNGGVPPAPKRAIHPRWWLILLPAVVGLVALGWSLATPAPRMVITSGEAGDLYHSLGAALASILDDAFPGFPESRRVLFVNEASPGTLNNVTRIRQGKAQIALAEEGIDAATGSAERRTPATSAGAAGRGPEVRTLVQLFNSPLKIVARQDIAGSPLETLSDLKRAAQARLAARRPAIRAFIGAAGTGTHRVASIVLDHYAFTRATTDAPADLGPEIVLVGQDWLIGQQKGFARAKQALERDEIQVAFFLTEYGSEAVRDLVDKARFGLLAVDRAEGINRWHPFLDVTTIHAASYPAARPFPARDTKTVAVDELLVAASTLSDQEAYRIVQAVFRNSHELRSEFPFMVPHTKEEQLAQRFYYPPHPGATAFFQGRYEPQGLMDFLQRYRDVIIALLSVSGTAIAAVHFFARRWWSRPLLRRLEMAKTRRAILAVDYEASRLFAIGRIDRETFDAVKEYVRVSLNDLEAGG
jgi:TRAP-type uncharacterized transport system substrate-binding protein